MIYQVIQSGVEYVIHSDVKRNDEELQNRINKHLEMRAKWPGKKLPREGDLVILGFNLDEEAEILDWLRQTLAKYEEEKKTPS